MSCEFILDVLEIWLNGFNPTSKQIGKSLETAIHFLGDDRSSKSAIVLGHLTIVANSVPKKGWTLHHDDSRNTLQNWLAASGFRLQKRHNVIRWIRSTHLRCLIWVSNTSKASKHLYFLSDTVAEPGDFAEQAGGTPLMFWSWKCTLLGRGRWLCDCEWLRINLRSSEAPFLRQSFQVSEEDLIFPGVSGVIVCQCSGYSSLLVVPLRICKKNGRKFFAFPRPWKQPEKIKVARTTFFSQPVWF